MDVLDNAVHAVLIEIAIIGRRLDAGAVTAMVVDGNDITMCGTKVHESVVALTMLRHTMNELQNANWMFREAQADTEVELVMLTLESELGRLDHVIIVT